jgi:hypothetical protein
MEEQSRELIKPKAKNRKANARQEQERGEGVGRAEEGSVEWGQLWVEERVAQETDD